MGDGSYPAEVQDVTVQIHPSEPMRWHEFANLFPMMEREAVEAVVEDVRLNGVREPIVMLDGFVLDGRNRYCAARQAGVPYPVVEFTGDDPLAYVISLNLKRRHLSESQRAAIAAKIANIPPGRPRVDKPANLPVFSDEPAPAPVTQAQAAQLLNVSERSVRAASHVIEHGAPALVASVEGGAATVSAAAEVARLPVEIQLEVVEAGPEAIREVASEIRRAQAEPDANAAAKREAIVEAAKRGLAGARAPSRRNPDHKPNPAFDAVAAVAGSCQRIIEKVGDDPSFVISGFLDDGMRERNIATFRAGRDALNRLLGACDAA